MRESLFLVQYFGGFIELRKIAHNGDSEVINEYQIEVESEQVDFVTVMDIDFKCDERDVIVTVYDPSTVFFLDMSQKPVKMENFTTTQAVVDDGFVNLVMAKYFRNLKSDYYFTMNGGGNFNAYLKGKE